MFKTNKRLQRLEDAIFDETSYRPNPIRSQLYNIQVNANKYISDVDEVKKELHGLKETRHCDLTDSYTDVTAYKGLIERATELERANKQLNSDVSKLKAVVAELCDYVYRDSAE